MTKYFSIILATIGFIFAIYEFRKNQKNKAVNGLGKLNKHRPPKMRIVYSRNQDAKDRPKIKGSRDVYDWFRRIWSSQIDTREEMYVLYLNRNNQILGYHQLSMGGINGTVADVRLLYSVALKSLASAVILAHNHPSGNLQPSNADIELTNNFKKAGELLNINLLDHLIISTDSYYSFADEGML